MADQHLGTRTPLPPATIKMIV